MKRSAWLAAGFLGWAGATGPLSAGDAPPPPALLEALAKTAESHVEREPRCAYTLTTRSEELDGKGKTTSSSEITQRIRWSNGRKQRDVLRATENGQDATARMKESRGGNEGESSRSGSTQVSFSFEEPFTAASQPQYSFHSEPVRPDLLRIRFEPRGAPSEGLQTGEALVDLGPGAVRHLRFHAAVLPKHTSRMDIDAAFEAETAEGRRSRSCPSRAREASSSSTIDSA